MEKISELFMDKITSKSNPLIKNVSKLLDSSKERQRQGRFVLEGARLCFDVLKSPCRVSTFLITESAAEKYSVQAQKMFDCADRAYLISQQAADRLSQTENTQGIFAVCELPKIKYAIQKGKKYIAMDGVQNPSNFGSVIRTAEALGIDGAICFNCCDAYNPKSLRASMGGILRLPVMISRNLVNDINEAKKNGFEVFASVPVGGKDITEIIFPKSSICVIGNEANGISSGVKAAADKLVQIRMSGKAESLNASAAGVILMWEMMRGI